MNAGQTPIPDAVIPKPDTAPHPGGVQSLVFPHLCDGPRIAHPHRGGDDVNNFLMDFRYGLRALRKAPGTTAVAALALALGIGVNTSSFLWVSALVLHPLPYPGLERIMTVWETAPKLGDGRDLVAPANFLDWRRENRTFEKLAAYRPWDANLTGAGEPERVQACQVTAEFFALLGMKPMLGGGFLPRGEGLPG